MRPPSSAIAQVESRPHGRADARGRCPMKAVRLVLIPLLLVAFASAVHAPVAMSATASPKSPDEMASEALAKWKTVLKLTDEQAPQFEAIMKDSYQKMADAKKEAGG